MEKVEMTLLLLLLGAAPLCAQRVETVPFGDFEHWTVRHIKESAVMGGEVRTLYVVGPDEVLEGNRVYDYSRTPWASSNAYAKVAGITKTSLSVEPDSGPTGRCAKLSTVFASCRVAGLVEIQDPETGDIVLLDTASAAVRDAFREASAQATAALEQSFRQYGIDNVPLSTADTDDAVVLKLRKLFGRRGRRR